MYLKTKCFTDFVGMKAFIRRFGRQSSEAKSLRAWWLGKMYHGEPKKQRCCSRSRDAARSSPQELFNFENPESQSTHAKNQGFQRNAFWKP